MAKPSCIAMCVLLWTPVVHSAAQAPIRIMGVLASSPPIASHRVVNNPLVPCETITDSNCKGGFPAMKAWLAYYGSHARGTVTFSAPDYQSRTVHAHPDGVWVNFDAWRRLGLDFVTMRNDHLLQSSSSKLEIERFITHSPYPWVMSDFIVHEDYAYLTQLLIPWHIKDIDGIKVGVLVLWSDTYIGGSGQSFAHSRILPILTRRLRIQGVNQIVVLRTGHSSTREDEFAALAGFDIDVVVCDARSDTSSFTSNGTTVLFAKFYRDSPDYNLLVLDMVQDGVQWRYSLKEVGLHADTPPGGPTNTVYFAAQKWAYNQVSLGVRNDIMLVESTRNMPGSIDVTGRLPCREEECELGVLTADAIREYAGTQLSLINSGSVRGGGWPAGPIKRSHLWMTYPFASSVCRVNVSGTLLLDIVNHGTSQLDAEGRNTDGSHPGLFPQISGFRFKANPQFPPGRRVVSLDVQEGDGTFSPLEKRRVYSLATLRFVLDEGDGYDMVAAHSASSECYVSTMLVATQDYLQRREHYEPHLNGAIVVNRDGAPLLMRNQSHVDCTSYEKHDAFWQDCVPCAPGFWRPDEGSNVCVEETSDVNIPMIVGIVVGAVVLLAIPLTWKLTEKQRRINALFNNNKVAEECAVAVMELRLSDLDYLGQLDHPNTIQSAFIAIVNQMKMYMEFMPKNMIANYHPSGSEEQSVVNKSHCTSVGTGPSGARRASQDSAASDSASSRVCGPGAIKAGAVKSDFVRRKGVSVLALNSRSHTGRCTPLEPDAVRVLHSQLIESFNEIIESHKGLAESMCGDRLLAAWNTVVYRPRHCVLACKAAYQMRAMKVIGVTAHVGISTGTAVFGLFGGVGTKKYDIVGKVVPGAMLLALLNKEYDTQCLLPHNMLDEASTSFYTRIVDYVSHSKLPNSYASFIYELAREKGQQANDEWMYQMEQAENADSFSGPNAQWTEFIKTGKIPGDLSSLVGKLHKLKAADVSGEYHSPCPGLALF